MLLKFVAFRAKVYIKCHFSDIFKDWNGFIEIFLNAQVFIPRFYTVTSEKKNELVVCLGVRRNSGGDDMCICCSYLLDQFLACDHGHRMDLKKI